LSHLTNPFEQQGVALAGDRIGRRFGPLWALRNLSFQWAQGEAVLVVGRNGAGKSTLIRLILGLDSPDIGSIKVFGTDPRHRAQQHRRRIGALIHDNALYPQLDVAETVDLWRSVARSKCSTIELLEQVGLTAAAGRSVSGLSAGMRKRLALCRSLMVEPELVIWDEPLSALDADGRGLIMDLWHGLREQGVTLVVSTHQREVFEPLADQVLDLDQQRPGGGGVAQ